MLLGSWISLILVPCARWLGLPHFCRMKAARLCVSALMCLLLHMSFIKRLSEELQRVAMHKNFSGLLLSFRNCRTYSHWPPAAPISALLMYRKG